MLAYGIGVHDAPLLLCGLAGLILFGAGFRVPAPRAKGGLKNGLTASLLVLAALTVSVLAGELIVRGTGPHVYTRDGTFRPHPKYIFEPKPGARGTIRFVQNDGTVGQVPLHISSQGLRDREYPPKQPGEYRILMLGDSFTMGVGVRLEDTIPKVLERMLRERLNNDGISAINAGCGGYGPWQERGRMHERGLPLEPDLVILQILPNNDISDTLAREGGHLRAYSYANLYNKTMNLHSFDDGKMRFDLWLHNHSHLYVTVLHALRCQTGLGLLLNHVRGLHNPALPDFPESADRPWFFETRLKTWYPELKEGWHALQQDVLGIQEDCLKRNLPLVAYALPDQSDFVDPVWEYFMSKAGREEHYERRKDLRISNAFFKRAGIPAADITDALEKAPEPGELWYRLDGHLTPEGTRLVAKCLADFLIARPFVQGPGGPDTQPSTGISPPD